MRAEQRCTERLWSVRDRIGNSQDAGFTIIEVLVAIAILAIVTLGFVPLMIAGLRASMVARLDTGAKNLAQERFELMRNFPFHVDVNTALVRAGNCSTPAGVAGSCDYRDLLDNFYRSVGSLATATNVQGYVVGTSVCTAADDVCAGNGRTKDEPASGTFYRFAIDPVPGFQGRYRQFTATQFLGAERAPLLPPAGYDSQTSGSDFPPSRFVGVTVITKWQAGALSKKFVNFTQISEGKAGPPAVTLQARATAVKITSSLPASTPGDPDPVFTMLAGISSSDGALSTGGSASTRVQGSYADVAPGPRADGKSAAASAPPNASAADGDGSSYSLIYGGGESSPSCLTISCVAFSIGGQVRNVNVSIVNDQPLVATKASPATGRVKRTGSAGDLNLGYRNKPDAASMIGLDISKLIVRIDDGGGGVSNATAMGSTYLTSATGGSHFAESGASAHTQKLKIVPTSFAPDGVVQVTLNSAEMVCKTTGSSSSGTAAAFDATVTYLRYNSVNNLNEYVSVAVQNGQAISPLTSSLLAGTQVSLNPGTLPANLVPLSTYLDSWSSLTGATTTTSSPPRIVQSVLSGIVTVTTKPTRVGITGSAVTVSVGNLSCSAEDNR